VPTFFDRNALKEKLRSVVLTAINEQKTGSIQDKVNQLRERIVAEIPENVKEHIENTKETFFKGATRLFKLGVPTKKPDKKSQPILSKPNLNLKSSQEHQTVNKNESKSKLSKKIRPYISQKDDSVPPRILRIIPLSDVKEQATTTTSTSRPTVTTSPPVQLSREVPSRRIVSLFGGRVDEKNDKPAVRPIVTSTLKLSDPSVIESDIPVIKTQTPVIEIDAPVIGTQTPVIEFDPPVIKTQTPVIESDIPVINTVKPNTKNVEPITKLKTVIRTVKPKTKTVKPVVPLTAILTGQDLFKEDSKAKNEMEEMINQVFKDKSSKTDRKVIKNIVEGFPDGENSVETMISEVFGQNTKTKLESVKKSTLQEDPAKLKNNVKTAIKSSPAFVENVSESVKTSKIADLMHSVKEHFKQKLRPASRFFSSRVPGGSSIVSGSFSGIVPGLLLPAAKTVVKKTDINKPDKKLEVVTPRGVVSILSDPKKSNYKDYKGKTQNQDLEDTKKGEVDKSSSFVQHSKQRPKHKSIATFFSGLHSRGRGPAGSTIVPGTFSGSSTIVARNPNDSELESTQSQQEISQPTEVRRTLVSSQQLPDPDYSSVLSSSADQSSLHFFGERTYPHLYTDNIHRLSPQHHQQYINKEGERIYTGSLDRSRPAVYDPYESNPYVSGSSVVSESTGQSYEKEDNTVEVEDAGHARARLPPPTVIQSRSKFPSNLGNHVEITPVYLTNSGYSGGVSRQHSESLQRHQQQIRNILQQQSLLSRG